LVRPGRDRAHAFAVLDAYDNVPMSEATRVLRGWRGEQAPAYQMADSKAAHAAA
jgi:hypothetical protein